MTESLTDRWATWLSSLTGPGAKSHVALRTVQTVIWPDLKQDGFAVPVRTSLQTCLTAGLADPGGTYNFAHVVNLIWMPLLQYMDSCASDSEPEWTEHLNTNHAALLHEMTGTIESPDEHLDIDTWVDYIKAMLLKFLQVNVADRLILQIMSPVVPFQVAPTRANALHLLRSSWCSKLVGPALAAQANRLILAEIAEVPVQLQSDAELNLRVRQDLIQFLEHQHCPPDPDDQEARPSKKLKRASESIDDLMKDKTEQVLYQLRNRVPAYRATATLQDSIFTLQRLRSSSYGSSLDLDSCTETSFGRVALVRHMLLLDGAIDRCTSDYLLNLREHGTFGGVAFATDESPPNQPRFRGLRFQITVLYFGTFQEVSAWETCQEPPFIRWSCLADIMHCPGKKGVDVSRILEMQLHRMGLSSFDVTSGTGDGGGENEGQHGVHAYMENLTPGYVRRRCIPHMSWRTCDLAIRVSGLDYKALAAYLVEGITWSRLQELATTGPEAGGLALFRPGSVQCKALFGNSPKSIVDNRPETDINFLKFLEGKENLLHRLATRDLEQRALSADTRASILNLGDIKQRIRRRILQELLERCLFLYYWSGKHQIVSEEMGWDQLVQKASSLILDLEITDKVLERFKMTEVDLAGMHARPRTWVELAVLQVVGEEDLIGEKLQEALDFHRSISDQAAAHLNLLLDNTYRTPWLAAKLLSQDKALARDSAAALMRHMASTRPENRTAFEQYMFDREDLWWCLEHFSKREPAVLLWHDHGRYESLFKFLAPRFLLGPDHVLDAERVHARWQWICDQKRNYRLQTLNADLRLMHYLENNQGFPSHSELLPNLHAERMEHRLALQALVDEDEVALGWRQQERKDKTNARPCERGSCRS